MFNPTNNKYQFKYLVTGLTGTGLECVYLSDVPQKDQILFEREQKFTRTEAPDFLKKAIREYSIRVQEDKNYIHPMQTQINQWCDQEWERTENGIWFWNNGTPTYITGFYYWFLNYWHMYFGYAMYRETDKELTYFLKFCEEDPNSFGLLFNTCRRYGKSSLMGAWGVYRASKNYNHYVGCQGENNDKVAKFYRQMIKNPFKRVPFFLLPQYNTRSTLATEIRFEEPEEAKKNKIIGIDDTEELGSIIDYRASGAGDYDGAVLHSYIGEEVGKVLECNINDRWAVVQPCLKRGNKIRGKAFLATTVEFLDISNKGGKAYKKLFFESDFNNKQPNGRTVSGLYACFLPADCAIEDYLDDWGHPLRDMSRKSILLDRESKKKNAKDLSDLTRKYPLSIKEIFYVNADRCEFNAQILQDRLEQLQGLTEPILIRGDFYWVDNKRFGEVRFRHNPTGWCWVHSLIVDPKEANLVISKNVAGVFTHSPNNATRFTAGVDPIDHGVVIEGKGGEDEYISTRRSRPVLFVKRKYDSSIDGILTQEILEERAKEKYPYKTNRYIAMMDVRPGDPNVYYERALLICWYFGCPLHAESQKPGIINYFNENNCRDFILNKYIPDTGYNKNVYADGTPASPLVIQEYTGALATYIEYFGHTIPFEPFIEDLLPFNPKKTTEFDYAVAGGFTELGERVRPKVVPLKKMDVFDIMPGYDEYGRVVA